MSRPCLGYSARAPAINVSQPSRVECPGVYTQPVSWRGAASLAGRCSYELEKKAEGAEHDADGTEDDFGRVGRERLGREAEVDGGRHDE